MEHFDDPIDLITGIWRTARSHSPPRLEDIYFTTQWVCTVMDSTHDTSPLPHPLPPLHPLLLRPHSLGIMGWGWGGRGADPLGKLILRVKNKQLLKGLSTKNKILMQKGDWNKINVQYFIEHCFICRTSDSTVSEDDGIEPWTDATSALAVKRSNHTVRSHPNSNVLVCQRNILVVTLPSKLDYRLDS